MVEKYMYDEKALGHFRKSYQYSGTHYKKYPAHKSPHNKNLGSFASMTVVAWRCGTYKKKCW
jgi:hypothetical protein